MDTLQYKDIFISEAMEHLDYLNQMLLVLEKQPGHQQSIHEIFRTAHTLKGMAATMGFDQITELTHQMENVLDKLRVTEGQVAPATIDALFRCLDLLGALVEEISSSQPKNLDIAPLLEQLKQLETTGASGPAPAATAETKSLEPVAFEHLQDLILSSEAEGFITYGIRIRLEADCVFPGVRAFMTFKALGEHGEIIATLPEAKAMQEGRFDRDCGFVLLSKHGPDLLKKSIRSVAEIESSEVIELKVNDLEKFWGDAKPVATAAAARLAEQAPAKGSAVAGRAVQSIRVSIERLDNLQNLVGELVINKIRLMQLAKEHNLKELKEALSHFDRISAELQDEVTEVRLVPMEHIFNRFPRMVRDLAKDSGKDLELVMEGKEIELDRTVLDEINDPLVHLLRNAVDHGIETPEERAAAGKGRTGRVRLAASREKNHIIIRVEDDGRGINPEVIRRAAVAHGAISAEDAARLSDQEAVNLVALPGVTTATVVTEVSGRGVGVDAVRSKIESFGGSLRIDSQPGQGSVFTLRMPMTLAIIQALLIRVGTEIYSIPVINTVEALELANTEIRFVQQREVVLYRETVLPLVRLHRVLDHPGEEEQGANRAILVTEVGDMRVGLLVDEVLGQQEIAIKTMGPMLKGVKGFSGVTILGDGRIALVLDVPSLI